MKTLFLLLLNKISKILILINLVNKGKVPMANLSDIQKNLNVDSIIERLVEGCVENIFTFS